MVTLVAHHRDPRKGEVEMNYDDMMGLGDMLTPEMVKDSLVGMGSGAGAIMLVSYVMPKIPLPASWTDVNKSQLRAGIGIATGLIAGRALYDYNRDAAMAVVGGVAGLGFAQLIGSFLGTNPVSGFGMLPEEMELSAMSDEALLASYGDNGAMNALAALEATSVQAARGAFSGPTVTNEQLFGLGAPVVQMETLGAYNPYMA